MYSRIGSKLNSFSRRLQGENRMNSRNKGSQLTFKYSTFRRATLKGTRILSSLKASLNEIVKKQTVLKT